MTRPAQIRLSLLCIALPLVIWTLWWAASVHDPNFTRLNSLFSGLAFGGFLCSTILHQSESADHRRDTARKLAEIHNQARLQANTALLHSIDAEIAILSGRGEPVPPEKLALREHIRADLLHVLERGKSLTA